MKNLKQLAEKIAKYEIQLQTNKDKKVQNIQHEIENIVMSLNFEEMFQLDELVQNLLNKK